MKKSIAVALAILCALALFASCTRRDNNYYYGPSVSVVTGLLTTETINTREITDIGIIGIYVLKTTNPINVIWVDGNVDFGEVTVNNISTIQVKGLDNFPAYIGKRVRLTGKFFYQETGHDYTEVVMIVDKYEPSVSVVTGIMTTKIMDPHDHIGTGLMVVDVITTDYPINVIEINDDALFAEESKVCNARVFHVINNDIDFSVYKDKRVRLTGYFYFWDRFYHYSKAVLFAEEVKVIR